MPLWTRETASKAVSQNRGSRPCRLSSGSSAPGTWPVKSALTDEAFFRCCCVHTPAAAQPATARRNADDVKEEAAPAVAAAAAVMVDRDRERIRSAPPPRISVG